MLSCIIEACLSRLRGKDHIITVAAFRPIAKSARYREQGKVMLARPMET